MITTSRHQIEPSVFVFFAVIVEPDPRVPHPPPLFSTGMVEAPAHSAQQPHTTTTHSTQHNTLHTAHYTPATVMAARSEPLWGSLVAQTPEDTGRFFAVIAVRK